VPAGQAAQCAYPRTYLLSEPRTVPGRKGSYLDEVLSLRSDEA
jgi:hypothetical protein